MVPEGTGWTERKTNEEVLRIANEKRRFVDAIRGRCWEMIRHASIHSEELHN